MVNGKTQSQQLLSAITEYIFFQKFLLQFFGAFCATTAECEKMAVAIFKIVVNQVLSIQQCVFASVHGGEKAVLIVQHVIVNRRH